MSAGARPIGRPRSAEVDAAIVAATLELLREEGFQGLSVEAVRVRAGVGKATIYRRFPDKTTLVRAAIEAIDAHLELPDTGSVRGDLEAVWRMAYAIAVDARAATFVPRLLAESAADPDLHGEFRDAFIEPRRLAIRTILRRGVERGELDDDLDLELTIDLLAGPVIYRLLIEGGRIEGFEAFTGRLFDAVLGWRLRPAG